MFGNGGREKEKEGRKKNRSHRATVQAPAKTARVERGGVGGWEGEKDPGETLNRCVKPLSAFLLGNARSGASRKTI